MNYAFTFSKQTMPVKESDYDEIFNLCKFHEAEIELCVKHLGKVGKLHFHGILRTPASFKYKPIYDQFKDNFSIQFKYMKTNQDKVNWIKYCYHEQHLAFNQGSEIPLRSEKPILTPHQIDKQYWKNKIYRSTKDMKTNTMRIDIQNLRFAIFN